MPCADGGINDPAGGAGNARVLRITDTASNQYADCTFNNSNAPGTLRIVKGGDRGAGNTIAPLAGATFNVYVSDGDTRLHR